MKIIFYKYIIGLFFLVCFFGFKNLPNNNLKDKGIRICSKFPNYWEYKGSPILLLGGSNDDNLFQWSRESIVSHLDSMKLVGANYVRNTMSDRKDIGFEIYPFKQLENGKYDLSKWNPEYWNRFTNFLEETKKRDIIVQLEIWDRFDYSKEYWLPNPYNPINNINYGYSESSFEKEYQSHPGSNTHSFFFTVPSLDDNQLILQFQKAFVNRMLEISLSYNHIIYCMDNETSGREEWSKYWATYIKEKAGRKKVPLTEMWDAHNLTHKQHLRTFDHPEVYDFVDISQNCWNKEFAHWQESQRVISYLNTQPRPVNNVKIYGNDASPSKSLKEKGIDSEHAVSCFFRNIIGGLASSRFHRPPSGLGLNTVTENAIKSIRMIEKKVKLWDMKPHMELLLECDENEAYISALSGDSYLVYFPKEGNVVLNIEENEGNYKIDYLSIKDARWKDSKSLRIKNNVTLNVDYPEGTLVLLQKEK